MNYAAPETAGKTHDFSVPVARLDALKKLGFSNDELYTLVAPRRTLARRRDRGEMLSPVESDRVLRLERIVQEANRIFADPDKAHRWLRKKCRALDDARPIELLQSETGAHVVAEELVRIDYGMFA